MILLARSYGNHSNRLFQNAAYEAFSLEYGVRYVNATLSDMAEFYPNVKPEGMLARRIAEFVGRVSPPLSFEPKDTAELLARSKKRLVLVSGWHYRDESLTRKWQPEIAKKFSVDEAALRSTAVYRRQAEWKRSGYDVVGVHVRRGDYSEWRGGRYLFSDEVYLEHVQRIGASGNVRFVIFPSHDHPFSESEEVVVSDNHWSYDHWLMANCDYLIGPPSTFTIWASYLGGAQYYHMQNPVYEFSREKLIRQL